MKHFAIGTLLLLASCTETRHAVDAVACTPQTTPAATGPDAAMIDKTRAQLAALELSMKQLEARGYTVGVVGDEKWWTGEQLGTGVKHKLTVSATKSF